MKQYKRSIQGAHLILVNLSLWRLGLPCFCTMIFDVPGLIVGLGFGLICHLIVRPYLSLNPFKLKQIDDQSQFTKLKHWMVPGGSNSVEPECYEDIEKNASQQSRIQLKELAASQGFLTGYDYANFCFLDKQLWARLEKDRKSEAAAKNFAKQRHE